MNITYTWGILQLDCYPEAEGQTDVVFTSHYTVMGSDGTYSGNLQGSICLTYEAGSDYISYADLTLNKVITWTQAALGVDQVTSIEGCIADQIQKQVTPISISPPLPWSN